MHTRAGAPLLAATALLLAVGPAPARADARIVSKVTVSGAGRAVAPQTIVTSYKGDIVRTETDRTISLYNTRTQTITTLNKQEKTYRTVSLKAAFSKAPGVLSRIRFNTEASMEPQEETKVIAGKQARRYSGKATLKMEMEGTPSAGAQQTVMEIEQWASEAVTLPPGARDMLGGLRLPGPTAALPGMKPLTDALSRVKGAPLSSRVSVTVTDATGTTRRGPIVTTNEVVSVSEAPLNPSLFQIPAGYAKVQPRAIPVPPAALRSRAALEAGRGH